MMKFIFSINPTIIPPLVAIFSVNFRPKRRTHLLYLNNYTHLTRQLSAISTLFAHQNSNFVPKS